MIIELERKVAEAENTRYHHDRYYQLGTDTGDVPVRKSEVSENICLNSIRTGAPISTPVSTIYRFCFPLFSATTVGKIQGNNLCGS